MRENGLIKENFFLLKALNVLSSENEQVNKFFDVYDGHYLIKERKKIAKDTYIIVSDDRKNKRSIAHKKFETLFPKRL